MKTRGRAPGRGTALLLGLLLGSLASVGCARNREPASGPPGTVGVPGPDTVSGTVRQVGNAPFARTLVQEEEGDAVTVTGKYEAELTRLVGAVVRASGEIGGGAFGPELAVTAYEILSVDGETPRVGILGRDEEGYHLEGPENGRVRLGAVPERFAELPGARVWVVTDERGTVLRYGVLREPPASEGEGG